MSQPRFTPTLQWSDPQTGMLTSEAQRILRALIDIVWNRTGLETSKVVTGTAGAANELAKWNADGDLVTVGDAAAARTLIGAQQADAELAAIATLTSAADKGIQFTGPGTAGTFDLTAFAKTLLDDPTSAAAQDTLGVFSDAHIYGLTLSNNATDATNDIDVSSGAVVAFSVLLRLSSSLTKRLDANWSVGSGNGGLDTGSIANTTYHVYIIRRPDTGVVDALFSTSATSPTMPTNYTQWWRIGSILRSGGAIRPFTQFGDVFKLKTSVSEYSATVARAIAALTLSACPTGIVCQPLLELTMGANAASAGAMQLQSANSEDAASRVVQAEAAGSGATFVYGGFFTNTSAQLRMSVLIFFGTLSSASIYTHGWIDKRGRSF